MFLSSRASLWLAGSVAAFALTGCSAPTIHGFTISSSPASVNINAGGTAYITVSAKATSGSNTAALVVYNLPPGVSSSPAAPTVATGQSTTITLTAAPNAPAANAMVQISGYNGLAHSTDFVALQVQ